MKKITAILFILCIFILIVVCKEEEEIMKPICKQMLEYVIECREKCFTDYTYTCFDDCELRYCSYERMNECNILDICY